jgi:hypothetical protein
MKQLQNEVRLKRTHYTTIWKEPKKAALPDVSVLVLRDFNAKIGKKEHETTTATDTHILHDDSSENRLRPIKYANSST